MRSRRQMFFEGIFPDKHKIAYPTSVTMFSNCVHVDFCLEVRFEGLLCFMRLHANATEKLLSGRAHVSDAITYNRLKIAKQHFFKRILSSDQTKCFLTRLRYSWCIVSKIVFGSFVQTFYVSEIVCLILKN